MSNDNSRVAWGRRLVICCDGTWQSSVSIKDNVPSNVTKLCRLIARVGVDKDDDSRNYHQIVYYDSGIGTGDISSFDARRQGGTGAGLAENVIEAYNFIVQNYEEGDEIFCFGFSRGAYTARAVAGLVGDIGVIKPTDMQFFPELYRLYMKNEAQEPFRQTDEWKWYTEGKLSAIGEARQKERGVDFKKNPPTDLQDIAEIWDVRPHGDLATEASRYVKVVGVWDTVGSLGVPDVAGLNMSWNRKQYGFHNVKLTEHVKHAYQALALDERRKAFSPTLWYIPKDLVDDPDRPTPELKQVWFPGVHINCGGGSQDSLNEMRGDSENISTATLCWMLQCISPHLTIDRHAFQEFIAQYKRWLFRVRFACTYKHKTIGDKIWSFVPKFSIPFVGPEKDEFAPPPRAEPHAHEEFDFSWGTGPMVDSYTTMYRLNGTHQRVPGHEEVENAEDKPPKERLLIAHGPTNEYIHPIVYLRSLVHKWDAHSPLKDGWTRAHWRGKDGKARFWWHKHAEKDENVVPEWAVLPHVSDEEYNFERYWYKECEKTKKTLEALAKVEEFGPNDFLETLDRKIDFGFDNKPQNLWP